jgi:WS/DGAT/MGAT family acyltransferase
MSKGPRLVGVMSDADALLWTIDRDPVLRVPIVAVVVLDQAPDWDTVREKVEQLTVREPRLRAKAVPRRFGIGNPHWEDDGTFDLAHHLYRVGAPTPCTLRGALDLAQIMGTAAFDPELPLWESVLITGLEHDQAAFILKIHHSVIDGIAGIGLLVQLLDVERREHGPGGKPPIVPPAAGARRGDRSTPGGHDPGPSDETGPAEGLPFGSLARSTLGRLATGARLLESAALAAVHPIGALGGLEREARSLGHLIAPAPTPLSPLLRGRGIGRRYATIDLPQGELHETAHALDCTMNDVFVAGVLGGLRRYHALHDVPVEHLRALVPISIRAETDATGGNRFVPARFVLDAGISDPHARVLHVQSVLGAWKHDPALGMTDAVSGLLNRLPPALTTLAFGSMLKGGDFVATNVPGPPFESYVAGARVIGLYAFAPTSGAAVNAALLTSAGREYIGIAIDTWALADGDVLVDCVRADFEEIASCTRTGRPGTPDEHRPAEDGEIRLA